MTEALRDYDDQDGPEPMAQVEARGYWRPAAGEQPNPLPKVRATAEVGMPIAEAELLGEYNLYNG